MRTETARGFDPAALYDPAHNFFDGMVVQASPAEIERRRKRRARLIIAGIAAACTIACTLIGSLLVAGQIPFVD